MPYGHAVAQNRSCSSKVAVLEVPEPIVDVEKQLHR